MDMMAYVIQMKNVVAVLTILCPAPIRAWSVRQVTKEKPLMDQVWIIFYT